MTDRQRFEHCAKARQDNGHELSLQCGIFERRVAGPRPAPDRSSLFGNGRLPRLLTLTPTLLALRLGATRLTGVLALVGVYCANICLEFETPFGSPSTVRVPSPPGYEVGVMIPLPHVLRVSNCLDILYSYFSDIFEWNRAQPPPFCATFDPHVRWVEIAKIAITPRRDARLNRPFGYVF